MVSRWVYILGIHLQVKLYLRIPLKYFSDSAGVRNEIDERTLTILESVIDGYMGSIYHFLYFGVYVKRSIIKSWGFVLFNFK